MVEPSGFGLYVHWPFCQAKCPYCDFNSHVSQNIDQDAWADVYAQDIERVARLTGPRKLNSIFLGGGTPSLMDPRVVERILATAQRVWSFANDIEITLEANPTSVEVEKFEAFRAAGVNRVSVGLQALNDADLRALGRLHTADEGRAAFDVAQSVFPRASFDLIYGRQHQGLGDWEQELAEAIARGSTHLSLYQLTIEPGTAFGDRFDKGKLGGLPDEDLGADMYALTQDMTEAAGLLAYEVSNHARPGEQSEHNLIYWRSGDWPGVGPGAHGRLTLNGHRVATEAEKQPGKWLKLARTGKDHETSISLSQQETLDERLLMGLRLTEGITLESSFFINKSNNINSLMGYNVLEWHSDRLRLTERGRPLLNAVLRELLA